MHGQRNDRSNPFVYTRPLVPIEGIPRTEEVEVLLQRGEDAENVALYAPRRMGKTSLLKQLGAAAKERKIPSVVVDLCDVLSVADVSERLLQTFHLFGVTRFGDLWDRERLRRVGFTAPGDSLFRHSLPVDPVDAVDSLLAVLPRIAAQSGGRVIVVLDDAEVLVDLERLAPVFDEHVGHKQVTYVFCVSQPSVLHALFEDPNRPLYGQELISLQRVPFAVAHDFIGRKFEESDKDAMAAVPELLRISELHPQRLMLLAHHVWNRAGEKPLTPLDVRLAYDSVMRSTHQELRYHWEGLSINERRVLAAVASGLSPYEAEARAMAGLASASSAQRAVQTLLGRAILERKDNALGIVDPLFARWIRHHAGARANFYVQGQRFGAQGRKQYSIIQSPAHFMWSADDLDGAVANADHLAARSGRRGGDVMIYEGDDPNDWPWTGLDAAADP